MYVQQRQVMNEGTIKLVNARHPVLLLRGKMPVGNDMSLDGSMQALILTGPNAGVVLWVRAKHGRKRGKQVVEQSPLCGSLTAGPNVVG